jgi:hypothetical protein
MGVNLLRTVPSSAMTILTFVSFSSFVSFPAIRSCIDIKLDIVELFRYEIMMKNLVARSHPHLHQQQQQD